jgi:hypothetical protein
MNIGHMHFLKKLILDSLIKDSYSGASWGDKQMDIYIWQRYPEDMSHVNPRYTYVIQLEEHIVRMRKFVCQDYTREIHPRDHFLYTDLTDPSFDPQMLVDKVLKFVGQK